MRTLPLRPLLLPLLLAGCQALPETPTGPARDYLCPNGNRISIASSADGQLLRLRIRGETHTLSRRGEGSPARWSDGRYSVEERESVMRVVIAGELLGLNCQPLQQGERPATALPAALLPGTLNYRQRIALSPEAVVTLRLLDVSRTDGAPLLVAEQVLRAPGQVPIPFALPYDERRVQANGRYVLEARIEENGQLRFRNTRPFAVLTQGQPLRADIWLDMATSP